MNVKEYLQQIYHMDREVKRLQARIEVISETLYSVRSSMGTMDPGGVRSSFPSDKIAETLARLDESARNYAYAIDVLEDEKTIIEKQIKMIGKESYKEILYYRYVLLWKWERIAVKLDFDIRHVHRLHGEALKEFDKIMRRENACH